MTAFESSIIHSRIRAIFLWIWSKLNLKLFSVTGNCLWWEKSHLWKKRRSRGHQWKITFYRYTQWIVFSLFIRISFKFWMFWSFYPESPFLWLIPPRKSSSKIKFMKSFCFLALLWIFKFKLLAVFQNSMKVLKWNTYLKVH